MSVTSALAVAEAVTVFDCETGPSSYVRLGATAEESVGSLPVEGTPAVGSAAVEVGVPELQSQVQFHCQLQSHACCWVRLRTTPSAVVHVQVHLNIPVVEVVPAAEPLAAGVLVVTDLPAIGDAAGRGTQDQFQVEPSVGAAFTVVAPGDGVPSPVQVQFHNH